MSAPKYAWMDGLVPWDDATCHISSLAFKYGAGVFEGIRAYWNEDTQKLYLWQMNEHLERLDYSQRMMRYDEPIPKEDVAAAVIALLQANAFRENVHITTTAFISGPGQPFVCAPVSLAITAMARGDYRTDGVSVQVSSWRRSSDSALPQRVKANGNYLNGRLASIQARADGYDTALLLTQAGKVSEGPAMCFFMVRDGVAVTPDKQSDILESITRDTVIKLLRENGTPVVERPIDRSELGLADEAFFCGTAWEVAPVKSIDRLDLPGGAPGPVTRALRNRFEALTSGKDPSHSAWRREVPLT